jgi:hypothetical protein
MLFSERYAEQLRELHDRDDSFGLGLHTSLVAQLIDFLKVKAVSDYGAGKQALRVGLERRFGAKIDYYPYDPAFPEYGPAVAAELVCCIEVLEHVEPSCLEALLADLDRVTIKYGFFTVNTAPAKKTLSDGRNAHLIQEPISWWLARLGTYFDVQWLGKTSQSGFALLVSRRNRYDLSLGPLEITQEHSLKILTKGGINRIINELKSRRFR